ncbi:hypothetical protein M3C61_12200 [Dermacoccus abyssi]|uniref:hypothetical protein n=1 Tax=Dermacoccus abyssi TaxID=322596 RepID=UPI0021A3ADC7|nr:hypothetical protein [Dermacoccus abyssi]MCT1987762.1 hypothetical protein [Dermacoccus abyssi]
MPRRGAGTRTTERTMVLAGLDDEAHKRAVQSWKPALAEDVALDPHARTMVDIRTTLLRSIPLEVPPLVD